MCFYPLLKFQIWTFLSQIWSGLIQHSIQHLFFTPYLWHNYALTKGSLAGYKCNSHPVFPELFNMIIMTNWCGWVILWYNASNSWAIYFLYDLHVLSKSGNKVADKKFFKMWQIINGWEMFNALLTRAFWNVWWVFLWRTDHSCWCWWN